MYGNFVGLRTSFLRAPAVRALNRFLYENFTNFYGTDQMAVIGSECREIAARAHSKPLGLRELTTTCPSAVLCMFVDMPGLGTEMPTAPMCDLLPWRAAAANGIFAHQ